MSAIPDNRSSDILFLRYDLIRRQPENERLASVELTGRVQPNKQNSYVGVHILSSIFYTLDKISW